MSTYLLFNKPYGVLSDFADREDRPTLRDYVPLPGLFEVGRLDLDSEGLMLLTNDGLLAHRLAHPHYHQPKTYLVQVEGVPSAEALAALRLGVIVDGQTTLPAEVELLPEEPALPPRPVPIRDHPSVTTAWLRITLHEGRKRQVRHMTAAAGHPTVRLVRIALGPLALGNLPPGHWRPLTPAEQARLERSVGLDDAPVTSRRHSHRGPGSRDKRRR